MFLYDTEMRKSCKAPVICVKATPDYMGARNLKVFRKQEYEIGHVNVATLHSVHYVIDFSVKVCI